MNHLRHVIDSLLVEHTAFAEALRRVEQCFANTDGAAEPICIAVIGESRTGKSSVLEECERNHPRLRTKDGWQVPIISVKTPSKPTVKGLAELMLHALGDPAYASGTENTKSLRLATLMQNTGTRMVMIDEFQHFYDKGTHRIIHHVADWLKNLVGETRVALVVSGLPSCCAVIEQNEQLRGRFLGPARMPRFDWANRHHRAEFIGILHSFDQAVGSHFDMPPLSTETMAYRCFVATGGLIGYLAKLVRQAVWDALDAGRRVITIEDLRQAHVDAVWAMEPGSAMLNPFDRTFPAEPTADMIARALMVGVHAEEGPALRGRPRKTYRKDQVGQVLCAR